ncbi:DUF3265 domain-containing protein [Vibrio cholerae]|nr:DUF3265 domain-containing protein [Vibrio navarrensis]EGR4255198.1 DUF3265 domain-containing protein [Vibrio cholerae]EJL6400841.1 DUF3265 domain-containing protein [Vibrio navarrensis]EJL6568281.1 DUF3265 domain-containing protein [Vibrio navarrensis]ELG5195360.1 DUF3265 domain-containing protein [Vibrio cholerae]
MRHAWHFWFALVLGITQCCGSVCSACLTT